MNKRRKENERKSYIYIYIYSFGGSGTQCKRYGACSTSCKVFFSHNVNHCKVYEYNHIIY